jgi:hypothetical protein
MSSIHSPAGISAGTRQGPAVGSLLKPISFAKCAVLTGMLAACAQAPAFHHAAPAHLARDHALNAPAARADWLRAGMKGPDVPPSPASPAKSGAGFAGLPPEVK